MFSRMVSTSSMRSVSPFPARFATARLYSSTMHNNDPTVRVRPDTVNRLSKPLNQVLDEEKRRNLSKIQHGTSTPFDFAPGWSESLATASEAFVKADHAPGSPAELQRKTVQSVHSQASEERDEVSGPLSFKGSVTVEREEITGPLRTAEGKEDTGGRPATRVKVATQHTTSEENVKADRGEI